jgi:hypothetical protein
MHASFAKKLQTPLSNVNHYAENTCDKNSLHAVMQVMQPKHRRPNLDMRVPEFPPDSLPFRLPAA